MTDEDRRKAKPTNDPDLEVVEAAWRRHSAEEPPQLLDQAVLNRARRDLEKPRPRRLRWIGQFATAGVAVIALSVWLLQDPGPKAPVGDAPVRIEPAAEPAPPPPPERQERRFTPASERASDAPLAETRGKMSATRAQAARPAPAESVDEAYTEEAADAAAERTPKAWIEHMLALQTAGRETELRAELDAFRAAYPDYPLPPALHGD
jgi:hypothetical protein